MLARLVILFIGVPILELMLFLRIGSRIGLGATLAIIILTGILGAWLTRIQGLETYARFQKALAEGRLPHAELLDGIMILIAGAVLLTPGFLTDACGFLLLVPPIRARVRQWLARRLESQVQVVGGAVPGHDPASSRPSPVEESRHPGDAALGHKGKDLIVDAEILDSERKP